MSDVNVKHSFELNVVKKTVMAEKKFERTSGDQLNHYLAYLEQHPELQASKMDPRNAHKIDDLWAKLSEELNALKGPIRDPRKWKQTLAHWKHQLRSKARKAKVNRMLTGGGPANSNANLSEFEERALRKFGAVAVEGVRGVATLGVQDETVVINNSTETVIEVLDEFRDCFEDSSFSSLEMSSSSCALSNESVTPSTSRHKKAKVTQKEIYTKIISLLESKNGQEHEAAERQQQLQQQMIDSQRIMAEAMLKVGEGLTAFTKVAESLIKK